MKSLYQSLVAPDIKSNLETLVNSNKSQTKAIKKQLFHWNIVNEISPVDIYCYCFAKYGPPNSPLNIFKHDDSDNLFHWSWWLEKEDTSLWISGMNYKTDIVFGTDQLSIELNKEKLITIISEDMSNYRKEMNAIRTNLEDWIQFVNPYFRVNKAIEQSFEQLQELLINPELDKVGHPSKISEMDSFRNRWDSISKKYSKIVAIGFGLRTMIPILAESFVNLLINLLAKNEIKNNQRMLDDTLRKQIDIRIQSLHLFCDYFEHGVDYSSEICKKLHSIFNDRNDILHGNFSIKSLTIGNVYFTEKTPIFREYSNFWDDSIGVDLSSVNYEELSIQFNVVMEFIKYVLSCIQPMVAEQISIIMNNKILGYNKKTNRYGKLFPEHVVDSFMGFE